MKWVDSLELLVPAVIGPRPVGMFSRPEDLCEVLELFLLANNAHHKKVSDFAGVIVGLNRAQASVQRVGELDPEYLAGRWKRLYSKDRQESFDGVLRGMVFERDMHACMYCGFGQALEAHHVIPQKLNGPHNRINLVACCKGCNNDIGATIRIPVNWWTLHPESRNAPKL